MYVESVETSASSLKRVPSLPRLVELRPGLGKGPHRGRVFRGVRLLDRREHELVVALEHAGEKDGRQRLVGECVPLRRKRLGRLHRGARGGKHRLGPVAEEAWRGRGGDGGQHAVEASDLRVDRQDEAVPLRQVGGEQVIAARDEIDERVARRVPERADVPRQRVVARTERADTRLERDILRPRPLGSGRVARKMVCADHQAGTGERDEGRGNEPCERHDDRGG